MKQALGATIIAVRPLTDDELAAEGWDDSPYPTVALVLSNGVILYASQDEEGNGPGALFGRDGKTQFQLFPIPAGKATKGATWPSSNTSPSSSKPSKRPLA